MGQPALLYAILHEKTAAEVISGSEQLTESQLRFMVRVKTGAPTTRWLSVVEQILIATNSSPWGLDISKQYFLAPHLRFGWRIILQSKDMSGTIDRLVEVIRNTQVKSVPHVEYDVPLTGSPNRSPTAGLMGSVATGPAAVR